MPPQALVFTRQGVLYISEPEKKDRVGTALWISSDDIFKIKLSLILLYGKLEIWGNQDAQVSKLEIEYNTVAHHLLAPILRQLIRKTWQKNSRNTANHPQDASFGMFEYISYSFYNGLTIEAIQPDEKVLGYVYQPEIRKPLLKVFYRKVFPQFVLALTDRQLILLQQDLKFKTHHEWIFTFIPLYRVQPLDLEAFEEWMKLTIHLLPESIQQKLEILLDAQNAEKWNHTWKGVFGT